MKFIQYRLEFKMLTNFNSDAEPGAEPRPINNEERVIPCM